jgi:hypothetical protein
MLRAVILVIALCGRATQAAAQDVNITFDEWAQMSTNVRAAYVAGLIDPIYEVGDERTYHVGKCIGGKMTLAQLSDAIRAHAEAQKSFHFRTVHEAMISYLSSTCPGF